jgi:signal transduction histidine kinase
MQFAGRKHADHLHLDVQSIFESARQQLAADEPANIEIICESEVDLRAIQGDASLICEALVQLIDNAVTALGEDGGTIRLFAHNETITPEATLSIFSAELLEPGAYVGLCVSDNGPGMPPEIVEHAVEPYFSGGLNGRGLGLAGVFGIMRGHKGGIQIGPAKEGGAAITLLFPAED